VYRIASLPVQISASPFWVESDEAAAARLVRLSRLPFVSSFNLTPVARGKLPTCPSPDGDIRISSTSLRCGGGDFIAPSLLPPLHYPPSSPSLKISAMKHLIVF
jgi:hypothetical protein